MTSLSSLLTGYSPLILLQSSASRSALPTLRWSISSRRAHDHLILITLLHPPSSLLPAIDVHKKSEGGSVSIIDWTECVPEYTRKDISKESKLAEVRDAISGSHSGPLTLVLDSVDTLLDDLESTSKTYQLLVSLYQLLAARKEPSRLILHLTSKCNIRPQLISTSFSPSLVHLSAFPPCLLTHIATAYLTLPPITSPSSDDPPSGSEKFWALFIPFTSRTTEVDALVFDKSGEGGAGGGPRDEIVVEVLVRGRGSPGGTEMKVHGHGSKRKGVERYLEGWSAAKNGPCRLTELEELKGIWSKAHLRGEAVPDAADPARNLSFNLNLTPAQQESKANVPLPYLKAAQPNDTKPGQILYDPDSADDIDEEDPDEDLDI